MDQPLVTIREALRYSFHLGIHSDLPWFTDLQYRAIRALDAIEDASGAVLSDVGGDGHIGIPNIVDTACSWPPGECED